MTRQHRKLFASMEAIQYQGGSFFKELTDTIVLARKEIGDSKTNRLQFSELKVILQSLPFDAIIKRHTNLNVKWELSIEFYPNAWCKSPTIDYNHPIINDWRQTYSSVKDGIPTINNTGPLAHSMLDLKTGKVSGYFAELPVGLGITYGLLANPKYTPEEIAAVILHEVGHAIGYFEYITFGYRTNAIIANYARCFFEADTITKKEVILKKYEESTGSKIEDKNKLATIKDDKALVTVLLKARYDVIRNVGGNYVYDFRSFEQLADDYRDRQGAARAGVTGLDKMIKEHPEYTLELRSNFDHIAIGVFQTISVLIALAVPVLGWLWLLWFVNSGDSGTISEYDNPKERFAKSRRNLTDRLKKAKPDEKKTILDDIKAISLIEKTYNDTRTHLADKLLEFFSSSKRAVRSQIQLQKELEELANNPLYVAANKLNTLGAK